MVDTAVTTDRIIAERERCRALLGEVYKVGGQDSYLYMKLLAALSLSNEVLLEEKQDEYELALLALKECKWRAK